MASRFGLFQDLHLACKALACLGASMAVRRVAGPAAETGDCSGEDPRLCAMGTSAAGRGLYVKKPTVQREVILKDVAVVDSICPQERIEKVFSTRPPERSRAQREPIWGMVTNFVYLLQDIPGHLNSSEGASQGSQEGAEMRERRRRLELFAAFYRPQLQDAKSSLYKLHAEEMHKAMDPTFQRSVLSDVVADLLTVVRLDAHIVRETGANNGLGLFFWLHLANHSCCPNAFFHTHTQGGRAKATLYALRPLASGEEVCISYVDGQTLLSPVQVRRRIIQNQFGFLCVCSRCREESREAQPG